MSHDGIQEVLARLDDIIARARQDGDRAGYFAALYREVTRQVARGIRQGRFEDGPRMERLDVRFAGRYLDARRAFLSGGAVCRSWRIAFEAAGAWSPVILQHLLLGMNAHINLDLGIAAAQTCSAQELPALRGDFERINDILEAMTDEVQRRIAAVSPWMWILDRVGQRTDERILGFVIRAGRDLAWHAAGRLSRLDEAGRRAEIDRLDLAVAALAVPIRSPGPLTRAALLVARAREARRPREIIDALARGPDEA